MEFNELLANQDYDALQAKMQARYQKNLSFFKWAEPGVYEKINGYVSKEVFLVIDDEGRLNLSNGSGGDDLVYTQEPYEQCLEYIDDFFKRQRHRHMTFKRQPGYLDEEDDIHITSTNKAIDYLDRCPRKRTVCEDDVVDSLFINGLGIGHIVTAALNAREVGNLVIFEQYRDVMAAAMHVLDFQELYESRAARGQETKVFLERDPADIRSHLMYYILRIGVHYYSNIYVINHFAGASFEEYIKDVLVKGADSFQQLGFFDDEQWSLTHTLENIRNEYPFVKFFRQRFYKPVFVIANGPSLEKNIGFLKENRDKAIYISCGSALSSLYSVGIKPDINVELERRYVTPETIENTTDPEYRKGILFVGSNTVHPDAFKMFERSCMFVKPNDLGEKVVLDLKPELIPHRLPFCTPNVGNTGLSLALASGCKNVYIFGMDCGFGENDEHHSTLSFYHKDEESSEMFNEMILRGSDQYVKGNFRENVKTTHGLKHSVENAERCLAVAGFKNAKVYNVSDGAFIKGAIPTREEDLNFTETLGDFDSSEVFHIFDPLTFEESLIIKMKEETQACLDALEEFIGSAEDHRVIIKKISMYLRELEDNKPYIYQLMKGSAYTWLCLMNRSLYKENSAEAYSQVIEYYKEFIARARDKVEVSFHELDDKKSNWF